MKETNFKETVVGLIPLDWEVTALGTVADEYGYGVGAEAIPFNGYDKYIRITDIDDENGQFEPSPITSPAYFSDAHVVKENDLLIARTGASVGKTYLYNPSDGKLIYAGFLMKVNIKKADSRFIFYKTKSAYYKNWVLQESARTGQPGINLEQIKTLKFSLPPTLAEQRRIAAALSDIDNLITSLDALIAKKQAIKQGSMQQLLTCKTRLEGFKDDWVLKELKHICFRYDNLRVPVSENLRKKGSTPYYGANGIQDYVEGYTHDGEFVLVAEDGANSLTDYPIRYVNGKIWVNNHAHVLQGKDGITDNKFLSYALKTIDFESNIVGCGRAKLNSETMMNLLLYYPPSISEQHAIAEILSDMDVEIETLQQKRNKYAAIKDGMMQQLLTGKIRLI